MFGRGKKVSAAKALADSVAKARKNQQSKKLHQAILELFQDRNLK